MITYDFFDSFPGLLAFTTTREGGVSTGKNFTSLNLGNFSDDKPENIRENQAILCRKLGIPRHHLINAHQQHTANVHIIDDHFLSLNTLVQQQYLEGVDALITDLPGICLAVTTADCVPVLLYDSQNQAMAAVHSGWRGTQKNILLNTFHSLAQTYHTQPQHLYAIVGPHISAHVYEVGEEVKEAFSKADPRYDSFFQHQDLRPGHFLLNLSDIIQMQLTDWGIPSEHLFFSDLCTFSRPDLFFSARRDSVHSGRMFSGILKK